MARAVILLAVALVGVQAQLDPLFGLGGQRGASKPVVPPEFRSFFELDGHARELVDSLMGPRPGGLFPERTFDIGHVDPQGPPHQISNLERTLESFFTATEGPSLPPGFGASGFSLLNNNKPIVEANKDEKSQNVITVEDDDEEKPVKQEEEEVEGSGESPKSSIVGIPNIFPKLPKAPVAAPASPKVIARREPVTVADAPIVPAIITSPQVPEGGFLPTSGDIRRAPSSVSSAASAQSVEDIPAEEYGGLSDETSTGSGGLIGTILNLISLGSKKAQRPEDKQALGKAVSNLIGGENSPLPAKSVLSNVLYKALTAGSIQSNETSSGEVSVSEDDGKEGKGLNLTLTPAQSSAIGEQLKMIQNLVIQPSSPLCTSKPEPVDFDFYAFLGQWYQVLYSPPLSSGPCSMVAYKKLSDVNNGGAGSLFEIFEYTTDATPYSKPKISSGYALVKAPGELIFRTNANQEDVNVHVIQVGPLNAANEYEYVVLSTNCNYPLYIFARDPVVYKQKYEATVTAKLEEKGLINGFSRLLNIVAPVDNTMCNFPPSLFNMQG